MEESEKIRRTRQEKYTQKEEVGKNGREFQNRQSKYSIVPNVTERGRETNI